MLRLPVISVEYFDIVTHSCATSFSIKLHFMKLTIYLIAATNSNLTILIHHSKNSLEKKVNEGEFLSVHQQLFIKKDFHMEARSFNIFETTNAKKLTRTILHLASESLRYGRPFLLKLRVVTLVFSFQWYLPWSLLWNTEKVAVMLIVYIFESYSKIKNLLKV